MSRIELDPTGADVGTENPYQSNEPEEGNGTLSSDLLSRFGDARDGFGGCIMEGIPASCNITISLLNLGYATLDPRAAPPAGGAEVAGGTAIWIPDDTPTSVIVSGSQQDPETGAYTAHLTVGITTRGRFQMVGGGVLLASQLSLRTVPQDPYFGLGEPPPPACRVNPITGKPGFTRDPKGKPGNMRPSKGGDGRPLL